MSTCSECVCLRAEVERLQGDENGMSTATVGSFAVGHLREMYRKAYDALGSSGRVSLRNHINSMVRRREAEAFERPAQIAKDRAKSNERLAMSYPEGSDGRRLAVERCKEDDQVAFAIEAAAIRIRQAASGESGT